MDPASVDPAPAPVLPPFVSPLQSPLPLPVGPPPLIRTLTGCDLDLDVFLALHRGAVTCPIARSLISSLHETLLDFRRSTAELDAANEKEFRKLEEDNTDLALQVVTLKDRLSELVAEKKNLLLKLEGGTT